MAEQESGSDKPNDASPEKQGAANSQRKIPGGLAYLSAPGALKTILDKIITASKPDKFTQDYLANVLGLSGGSYRAALPILRRVGFLTTDGTPTALYAKFRTESGRAEAAYGALRAGFTELFKRSEHVYAATDAKLTDLIVEITGLNKDDATVRAMRGTFRIFTSFLPSGFTAADIGQTPAADAEREEHHQRDHRRNEERGDTAHLPYGLAYQINIVLPESKDIEVYNLIFQSLRDNLLRI